MENKLCLYLAAVAMVLQTTAGEDATPPLPKPFGRLIGITYQIIGETDKKISNIFQIEQLQIDWFFQDEENVN